MLTRVGNHCTFTASYIEVCVQPQQKSMTMMSSPGHLYSLLIICVLFRSKQILYQYLFCPSSLFPYLPLYDVWGISLPPSFYPYCSFCFHISFYFLLCLFVVKSPPYHQACPCLPCSMCVLLLTVPCYVLFTRFSALMTISGQESCADCFNSS